MNNDFPTEVMRYQEQNLIDQGNGYSVSLQRAKERLAPADYWQLVEWAAFLSITRGLSHNTGENYIDAVVGFQLWLKGRGVTPEAATAAVISDWQQHLFLKNRERAQTRSGKLTAIRQWYGWREQMGLGLSPAREISGPKREKRLPRKYSQRQLKAMFASCDRTTPTGIRDFAILLLFVSTGARRAEVAGLTLPQIAVTQRKGIVRFLGKGAKERQVSFGPALVAAMEAWLLEREKIEIVDHDAVFVGVAGKNKGHQLGISGLYGIIRRAMNRAGIDMKDGIALHTLRATYATALYDDGADIEAIRQLMGHDSIETTRRYIAISERQLRIRVPNDFINNITGESHDQRKELPLYLRLRNRNHDAGGRRE